MAEHALFQSFLEGLPPAQRDKIQDPASLEQALERSWTASRTGWPTVDLDPRLFGVHLAHLVPADVDPLRALAELHLSELYLACACASGVLEAVAVFEQRYAPIITSALRKMRLPPAVVDEVRQVLREQLLVGSADRPPVIRTYSGRGHLDNWLRVVTARTATRYLSATEREVPLPEEKLDQAIVAAEGSELHQLKEGYAAEFRTAFLEALSGLQSEQRTLLKQHYLDGLSIDELGALYRVHRATAARWVASAREALLQGTRETLMQRLRVSGADCDSILRFIESRMSFTFRSYLEGDTS